MLRALILILKLRIVYKKDRIPKKKRQAILQMACRFGFILF